MNKIQSALKKGSAITNRLTQRNLKTPLEVFDFVAKTIREDEVLEFNGKTLEFRKNGEVLRFSWIKKGSIWVQSWELNPADDFEFQIPHFEHPLMEEQMVAGAENAMSAVRWLGSFLKCDARVFNFRYNPLLCLEANLFAQTQQPKFKKKPSKIWGKVQNGKTQLIEASQRKNTIWLFLKTETKAVGRIHLFEGSYLLEKETTQCWSAQKFPQITNFFYETKELRKV